MLKAIQKSSIRQMISQGQYDFPKEHYERGMLMLGGSTHLNYNGTYFEGDLSGITAKKIPFFFQHYYKPGDRIAKERNWEQKLEDITLKAKDWDIGIVVGVPAWVQILFEKIIDHYKVNTIHDIWPNLAAYVHGGVAIAPYKKGFEKLLAKPVTYIETYLASEGFIAYQDRQMAKGLRLVTNEHIFLEFVPFDDKNFDSEGNMVPKPEALLINEVEEGKDYAILLSTSAGAWRYLIGDTVRFVDKTRSEIMITGRTKHFLSLVGEHLSVDNMTRAVQLVSEELNISVPEFTVAGVANNNYFSHHWYLGCDDIADPEVLATRIDEQLKVLNDDYAVERKSALKDIRLTVLPESKFLEFMHSKGKMGGQHKFPRVLKGKMLEDWKHFLANETQLA